MIVPHAHMERMDEISPEAWAEIPAITREAGAWLERRGYLGYSFLLRDEAELGAVGKSIPHLHIHLVPGIFIGPGQK